MDLRKRAAALTLAAVLTAGTMPFAMAENAVKDDMVAQIAADIRSDISTSFGEGYTKYTNLAEIKWMEAQPARFDLRDLGIVPPIRSQGTMGTCWSFGSVAACETSILSSLNMTTDEFSAANGVEMDLSEKQLAWFSSVPMPDGPDQDQAGEGRYMFDPDIASVEHYQIGGEPGHVSGMLASGIGPVYEVVIPYEDSEGTDSMAGDWSLDENLRFVSMFDLKDSSILPAPAGKDADGNYVYNPVATAMIKSELLKGRAVSIGYYADRAMDPNTRLKANVDNLVANGFDRDIAEYSMKLQLQMITKEEVPEELLHDVMRLTFSMLTQKPYSEITDEVMEILEAEMEASEAADMTEEELAALEAAEAEAAAQKQADVQARINSVAEKLDADPEYVTAVLNSMNDAIGKYFVNWDTYAQYVSDNNIQGNHVVAIVGYDDDYAVSNFRDDNPPPAPGAWIVRNSWGTGYGNDGYFYLSYYDQTIGGPETFEFVTDVDAMTASELYIHQYDLMPAISIHSALAEEPVYMANEFTVQTDSVLSYVSAMTANYDTNVTVAVYLLNEDAKTPTDGDLLDVRTVNYEFAGYHRIALNQHYLLPAGTRISVVQTQRINKEGSRYYALPYTYATNRAFAEVQNILPLDDDMFEAKCAVNGVINHGESFVSISDEWNDWADIVENVKDADTLVNAYSSFDNISIKAYFYLLSDINAEHTFGEPVPYANGTVQLCTDCGYALVMQ